MRSLLILGGCFVLLFGVGCATVTKTAEENSSNVAANMELESRMMADDWNMIWMVDRPSRLSKWVVR